MDSVQVFTIVHGVLLKYSGCGGKVIVPSGVVRTEEHCSLDHLVFCKNETITEIDFPEGLEEIGSEACYGCSNLTSVKFPSTLKRIGDRAFARCVKLDYVEIPSSVRSIGSAAFADTLWLNSAPSGAVYIGTQLSRYKGNVPDSGIVTIRPGTTRIADSAFCGVKGMTGVEIPSTCFYIGSKAFQMCTDLRSIVIPETVTGIGSWLFDGCTALERAVIPNCRVEDGPWIFEGCRNLKYLTIPESFFGIYERLVPSLIEIRITGVSFTQMDRNWFVDPKRTVIISTLPLRQFPKEARLAAILGFARQYCENSAMPESYKDESLRYLRRIKKKMSDVAKKYPELLEMMVQEKMISAE